ncbi:phenol hydroxylase subunit [Nevskia sp.]|uniref:phenol hydroxylase subunit n=1 Tax=Nevskia sp. TaxID=1929292 RepID=UPI003F6E64D7
MANPATGAPAPAPDVFDVSRRYVRVLGERRGLIEFAFAIGEPDTAIELLLPPDDFRAFCRAQNACVLDAAGQPLSPAESCHDR